jgi:hypothetical protein
MKTRVFYFTMLFVFLTCGSFAQENQRVKIHQVGVNFSSLNAFGLHYKTGSEKTLLRMTMLSMNLGASNVWGKDRDSLDINQQSYGAGFRIGFEKHIPLVTRLDFIWGLEAGCNFNYQKQSQHSFSNDYDEYIWSAGPMVDAVLGARYTFGDHLVIGAEITPDIHYSYGKGKRTSQNQTVETMNSSFGFGFSNNWASLSLAYRFGK